MKDDTAAQRADGLINMLIQHQPHLLAGTARLDESAGKQLAQGLAALRAELIELLRQQP